MTTNRFWQLNSRPEAQDVSGSLSLESEAMPELADGELLVQAAYLSMDAGTRMWMTEREDSYQPPLELGTKMVGLVLGHVTASRHDGFAEGDLVRGFGQWAEYSVLQPELAGLVKVDDSVEDIKQHFGVLGFNGWTALWGVQETAGVKAGDNVLVSAAAGATGVLMTSPPNWRRSMAGSTPISTMSADQFSMPSCPIWRSTAGSRYAACSRNMKATAAVGDRNSSTRY